MSSIRISKQRVIKKSFTPGGGRWDFRCCGFGQCLFGFSVFALENCVFFGFGVFHGDNLLQFSLWFSVFVNNDGGFSFLFFVAQRHFRVFLVLPVSNSKGPFK